MSLRASHVVIQTAFLGDLFLTIPTLLQLKETYPSDKLILICKRGQGEYFLRENIVDEVIEVIKGDTGSYQKVISKLGTVNVINLFCIHRSLRSQILSWKISAQRKIGFTSIVGKFIFNDLIKYEATWPDALRQLKILTSTNTSVAAELQKKDWAYLNLASTDGTIPAIPLALQNPAEKRVVESKRIAIFPGSVWNTKRWHKHGFAKTAKYFFDAGYEVNWMGGPEEKNLCEEIKAIANCGVVLAGKKSIAESVSFIRSCALVICNDSAPTHMAASFNIPVVSIFGPTTLDLGFRPWSSTAIVVQNKYLECRPCGKHGHQKCPVGHHRCMTEIDSETVIAACKKLLMEINS